MAKDQTKPRFDYLPWQVIGWLVNYHGTHVAAATRDTVSPALDVSHVSALNAALNAALSHMAAYQLGHNKDPQSGYNPCIVATYNVLAALSSLTAPTGGPRFAGTESSGVWVEFPYWGALLDAAKPMTSGAAKHGAHTYRRDADIGDYFSAAMRHIVAHLSGELHDPETGNYHLAHAAASLLVVSYNVCLNLGHGGRWDGTSPIVQAPRSSPAPTPSPSPTPTPPLTADALAARLAEVSAHVANAVHTAH